MDRRRVYDFIDESTACKAAAEAPPIIRGGILVDVVSTTTSCEAGSADLCGRATPSASAPVLGVSPEDRARALQASVEWLRKVGQTWSFPNRQENAPTASCSSSEGGQAQENPEGQYDGDGRDNSKSQAKNPEDCEDNRHQVQDEPVRIYASLRPPWPDSELPRAGRVNPDNGFKPEFECLSVSRASFSSESTNTNSNVATGLRARPRTTTPTTLRLHSESTGLGGRSLVTPEHVGNPALCAKSGLRTVEEAEFSQAFLGDEHNDLV
ncbi:unnamed protein product [Amoebophrya sp. A25]|nr:unnamed protein product [Amoebophrya sp. A25]|eukprot:GSA25T00007144001.1